MRSQIVMAAFARLVPAPLNRESSRASSKNAALRSTNGHLDAPALAAMLGPMHVGPRERFAREGSVRVSWERLWQIEPVVFNRDLISLCDQAIRETAGKSHRLPSGPLHDAAEVARAGIPTVMMFVQSLLGISHNKIEDTRGEHIEAAVAAFDNLADKAMTWVACQE